MSTKTHHFDKADKRIAQKAIQEGVTSSFVEGSENSEDQTLLEEEFEDNRQLEPDSAEQCFCDGGGCVCEEIVLHNNIRFEPEDESTPALDLEEEDRTPLLDRLVSEMYGGNLSVTSTPSSFLGKGFN